MPAALRPAIVLSHWGRKDANHTSGTAYGADFYSAEMVGGGSEASWLGCAAIHTFMTTALIRR